MIILKFHYFVEGRKCNPIIVHFSTFVTLLELMKKIQQETCEACDYSYCFWTK